MKKKNDTGYISFKDAVTEVNNIRNELKDKVALTEDELILLVLGIVDKPVTGKVVLQKEIFLFLQELRDKVYVTDPHFVPFKYGPYSFRIATLLEFMEELGYIKVVNKRYKRIAKYMLTRKGKELAGYVIRKIKDALGENFIKHLKDLRQGLDELGHDGILRYVYQHYKEYTDKSELKEKYIHIDWGVTEA